MTREKPSAPSALLTAVLMGLFAAGAARAQTQAPVPPKPAASPALPPGVSVSSTAVSEPGVADLYPLEKMHLRDPFLQMAGGASSSGGASEMTDFSIHALVLKGIMQDKSGDFALLIDSVSGSNFVLKKGHLYDRRNKPVPGVSGIIKPKQKTVHLITSEKDVQTFILGEEGGP